MRYPENRLSFGVNPLTALRATIEKEIQDTRALSDNDYIQNIKVLVSSM